MKMLKSVKVLLKDSEGLMSARAPSLPNSPLFCNCTLQTKIQVGEGGHRG